MNKRVDIEIFVCSTVSWEKQVEKKTQKQNKEKYETDAKRNSLVNAKQNIYIQIHVLFVSVHLLELGLNAQIKWS